MRNFLVDLVIGIIIVALIGFILAGRLASGIHI